jgi:hypothetical protein
MLSPQNPDAPPILMVLLITSVPCLTPPIQSMLEPATGGHLQRPTPPVNRR